MIIGEGVVMEKLNRIPLEDIVDELEKRDEIEGLYSPSEAAIEFFGNPKSLEKLVQSMDRLVDGYPARKATILKLIKLLRSGFTIHYASPKLAYLAEREAKDPLVLVLEKLLSNPAFSLKNGPEEVEELSKLVEKIGASPSLINSMARLVEESRGEVEREEVEEGTLEVIVALLSAFENGLPSYSEDDSVFKGRIDGFIDQLETFTDLPYSREKNRFLILNKAIVAYGNIGKYHSQDKNLDVLTQILDRYEELSEPYLNSLAIIVENYGGKDKKGRSYDFEEIKKRAEERYYPKKYDFDSGSFIIRAGDRVAEEKILRLYWAAKEVEAQFFRSISRDRPIEEGNPDDRLTVIIYNNPREYSMNNHLNDLPTNNGGMYIEGIGTFYTFERTKDDSRYTLEELFRHEFVHYLQGRYVVPGMWGEMEIYEDERMTWYEEGGAEYFAGSTRCQGVRDRKSLVKALKDSRPGDRYDFPMALSSSYSSGFDFYNYSYMCMNYLNRLRPEVYKKISDFIMANDVEALDAYVSILKENQEMNREYMEHMEKIISSYDRLTVPLVSDDYLDFHSPRKEEEIIGDLQSLIELDGIECHIDRSEYFDFIRLEGRYRSKSTSKGELLDRQEMTEILDRVLKDLSNLSWSGYSTYTAYCKTHRVNNNKLYEYNLVFRGIKESK